MNDKSDSTAHLQLPEITLLLLQPRHIQERVRPEHQDDSSLHTAVDVGLVRADVSHLPATEEACQLRLTLPPAVIVPGSRVTSYNVPDTQTKLNYVCDPLSCSSPEVYSTLEVGGGGAELGDFWRLTR